MFWKKLFSTESWKLMLNFSTFSVGGCWGQPMSLFKKLIDETQMPKAQECTDNYIFTKKLFLAGLRGLQSISNPVERPCTTKWHEWWNVSISRRFCIPEQSQFCEFELVEIGNIPYFLPVGTKKLQNWGNFGMNIIE